MDPQILQSLHQTALDISKWSEPPRWRILKHRKWRRNQQPDGVARRIGEALRGDAEPIIALVQQTADFITDLESHRRKETGMIRARIGGIHPRYVDTSDTTTNDASSELAGFEFDLVVTTDLTYEETLEAAARGDHFELISGSVWVLYSFTESSCRILEGVYPSRDRAFEHGEPGMHVGRVNFGDGPELGRGVEIFDWEELT